MYLFGKNLLVEIVEANVLKEKPNFLFQLWTSDSQAEAEQEAENQ